MNQPETNNSRIAIHTVTTKAWNLETAIRKYTEAGIGGISVWQSYLEEASVSNAGKILSGSGLKTVSLVRGGFFTGTDEHTRKKSIDHNIKMIRDAGEINAEMLVLVCGSTPGQTLKTSREQILKGIESILPEAEKNKVKLAVEPLHPVYSDSRSAINTLSQANDIAEKFNSSWLGVALDVYHVWWDPELYVEIERCGRNDHLLAVHLCDWRVPTRDILNDREIMGKGIINIQEIIDKVKGIGFSGLYEVEIFSNEYWSLDTDQFFSMILDSVKQYNLN
jgi:sugar phosphate isomerase/epimerase